MHQGDNIFGRLLPIDTLYSLYIKIGENINTPIDLANANYDYLAKQNSLELLKKFELIFEVDGHYQKTKNCKTIQEFTQIIADNTKNKCLEIFELICASVAHYDERRGQFYGYRNDLPLDISGIVMLLEGIGLITLTDTRYYLNEDYFGKTEKVNRIHPSSTRNITLSELDENLLFNKQIGDEAELVAMEFEKQLLKARNINKEPIRISIVDVSAGYDIASYESNESKVPDRFIEVKSCGKLGTFYLSKNEIEVARRKGDKYYLYLYNRLNGQIRVIQNPYINVFKDNRWAKELQIVKVWKL